MLQEFFKIRQEKDGYRRFFSDEEIDLYIWYDKPGKHITGFQLVYGKKNDDMRALTWEADKGFSHTRVDDEGWYNPSPILVRDGVFDRERIVRMFEEKSAGMDKRLKGFLLEKIRSYKN